MALKWTILVALGMATPAFAQSEPPSATSPLEIGRAAGDAFAAQAQADQQARIRAQAAAARRESEAALTVLPPLADDGRQRSTGGSFDQTIGSKSDTSATPPASPYGSYYGIHTPWSR